MAELVKPTLYSLGKGQDDNKYWRGWRFRVNVVSFLFAPFRPRKKSVVLGAFLRTKGLAAFGLKFLYFFFACIITRFFRDQRMKLAQSE
jgi:hypothetical protein